VANASSVPERLQAEAGDAFQPRDRILRLFESAPVSPVWVGLGIALAYLALFVGFDRITGVFGPGGPGESWASQVIVWESVNAMLIGYLLTVNALGVRSARTDLASLRPHLAVSDSEFDDLEDQTTNLSAVALWGGGAVGVLGGAMLPIFDAGVWGDLPRPPFTSALFLWVLFRNSLIGWAATRSSTTEFALTRGFARAAKLLRIDLLDARRLSPFARKSQRSVAGLVGFIVLFSLFFLGRPADSNPFFLVLLLGLLLAVFLIPLIAVRRQVVAAKTIELERVNGCIRSALGEEERGEPGARPRLADWVAYRSLVEGVREWPINVSGLLRSLLFAALGVGSWLGGAVVERLLGAALD
jgi:hypothetical protein